MRVTWVTNQAASRDTIGIPPSEALGTGLPSPAPRASLHSKWWAGKARSWSVGVLVRILLDFLQETTHEIVIIFGQGEEIGGQTET